MWGLQNLRFTRSSLPRRRTWSSASPCRCWKSYVGLIFLICHQHHQVPCCLAWVHHASLQLAIFNNMYFLSRDKGAVKNILLLSFSISDTQLTQFHINTAVKRQAARGMHWREMLTNSMELQWYTNIAEMFIIFDTFLCFCLQFAVSTVLNFFNLVREVESDDENYFPNMSCT